MKKRILAWLLIFCLLAVPLAGCGDSEDAAMPDPVQAEQPDGAQEASPVLLSDCVYQADYLDFEVDDSYQFQGVDYCCVSGPYAFFCGKCAADPEKSPYDETALFRMDLETGEIVRLDDLEAPEGSIINIMPLCMTAGPDGTFWFAAVSSILTFNSDTQLYSVISKDESLCQYDANGQVLKTVPFTGLSDLSIQQLFCDETGTIYLNTSNGVLYLLDAEGNQLAKLPNEAANPIYQLSSTEIGIFDQGVFRLIDPAARALGESVRLPDNTTGVYPGIQDYTYLYEDSQENLYGYKSEAGESELLLNWLNCDVDRSLIRSFSVLEDGRVAAVTQEINWKTIQINPYRLALLKPVDPAAVPQKQELTLACLWVSSDLRSAVVRFNQSQSDIKIIIEDYSQYNTSEDSTAGMTRLFTEILAGQIPDLLYTSGMPVQQLAAQDILADLWPLIDSDEELSRDDLMTHLFDLMSIDGKLYQTASSFYISATVGNGDVLGSRTSWTLAELMEAAEAMPDGSTVFGPSWTKNRALSLCLGPGLDSLIDWETQTCSFDSPEFIEILNFANSFPDEYDGTALDTTYERFQEGTQLLLRRNISSLQDMQFLSALVGGNPCYVNISSPSGSVNSFLVGDGLAITTACQNADAAWRFLRAFLTEEYQTQYVSGLPTNRRAFGAMEADAEEGYLYTEEGVTIQFQAVSQEDYDLFMQLYESCDHLNNADVTISNIVKAEIAPFFAGQKTAEEVAALIQNRVGLYVMEQN